MNDSLPLEVKGITIHNTGTTESASELRDKMKKVVSCICVIILLMKKT